MAKKQPIVPSESPREINEGSVLRVRRGRVESVDLYEIKDSELDILETGSPASTQLNFAIFLLTIAFAAIIALFTAEFINKIVETAFIVISVVGILLGAYFLTIYRKSRVSNKSICSKIRERMTITDTRVTKSVDMPSEVKNNNK